MIEYDKSLIFKIISKQITTKEYIKLLQQFDKNVKTLVDNLIIDLKLLK